MAQDTELKPEIPDDPADLDRGKNLLPTPRPDLIITRHAFHVPPQHTVRVMDDAAPIRTPRPNLPYTEAALQWLTPEDRAQVRPEDRVGYHARAL